MIRKWLIIGAVAVAILVVGTGRDASPTLAQTSLPLITAANVTQVRPLTSIQVPHSDDWGEIYSADHSLLTIGYCLPSNSTQVFDTRTGALVATINGAIPHAFTVDSS